MATSDYDNAVNYNVTISQKEHCASIAMRGTVETRLHHRSSQTVLFKFYNFPADILSLLHILFWLTDSLSKGTMFHTTKADTKAADKHNIRCANPLLFRITTISCINAPLKCTPLIYEIPPQ